MRARVVVIPEENGEFLLFSFGRIVLVLNFLLRILNMKWPNTTHISILFLIAHHHQFCMGEKEALDQHSLPVGYTKLKKNEPQEKNPTEKKPIFVNSTINSHIFAENM